jgi:cyclic pyranopterin phosphate synthase
MQTAEATIDRLSFEKVFYFPEHLRKLVRGEDDYPIHMQIGPVNFCNHDCTFCYAARTMFDAKNTVRRRMDVERLMEIIEEMHELGLRAATLVGAGEPTLHPRIADIIEGMGRRGVEVAMFTNGSCVTDRTARAIADRCTFIRFSMTGATPEIHHLVHANGDFERVIANIERIVAARKGKLPTLGSQFILASYSATDVVKGAKLAKSIGLDYFEIKPAYIAPDKPDQMENTLTMEEARDLMQEAKGFEDDAFKVYAKTEQVETVLANLDDRDYHDCPGHTSSATLEADFELYICVNQKIPEFSFGNLSDQSFQEVWQGRRRRQILEKLDVHKCIPRCRQDPLNRIVHEVRTGQRTVPPNLPEPDPQMHVSFL